MFKKTPTIYWLVVQQCFKLPPDKHPISVKLIFFLLVCLNKNCLISNPETIFIKLWGHEVVFLTTSLK